MLLIDILFWDFSNLNMLIHKCYYMKYGHIKICIVITFIHIHLFIMQQCIMYVLEGNKSPIHFYHAYKIHAMFGAINKSCSLRN